MYDILINKLNLLKNYNNRLSLQLFKLKTEIQIQRNNVILDNSKKNLSGPEISLYDLNNKYVNRMINTYDQLNKSSYEEVI